MVFISTIPNANDNISTSQGQLRGNNLFLGDTTGTNNPVVGEGYYKLPNGLLIQWGSKSKSGAVSRVALFPIAFSGTLPPFSIQVSAFGTDPVTNSTFSIDDTAGSIDNTKFTIKNRSGLSLGFYWFAIGLA